MQFLPCLFSFSDFIIDVVSDFPSSLNFMDTNLLLTVWLLGNQTCDSWCQQWSEEAHCKMGFWSWITSWLLGKIAMQLLEVLKVLGWDGILVKVNVPWRWNVSDSRIMGERYYRDCRIRWLLFRAKDALAKENKSLRVIINQLRAKCEVALARPSKCNKKRQKFPLIHRKNIFENLFLRVLWISKLNIFVD